MRGFGPQGRVPARPDFVTSCLLTTTAQAFDVPAGGRFVSFAGTTNFAVTWGTTSAIFPAATSTAGTTGAEINPLTRDVGSTLSTTGFSMVGAAAGGLVTMTWWGPGG